MFQTESSWMESALLRQPMCKNEMQENSRKIIEHDKFADFCLCSFVICCNYQFAIVYFTCCSVCCECLLFFSVSCYCFRCCYCSCCRCCCCCLRFSLYGSISRVDFGAFCSNMFAFCSAFSIMWMLILMLMQAKLQLWIMLWKRYQNFMAYI